ncbi:unnamed protein product, partial [Effrenium voratum]
MQPLFHFQVLILDLPRPTQSLIVMSLVHVLAWLVPFALALKPGNRLLRTATCVGAGNDTNPCDEQGDCYGQSDCCFEAGKCENSDLDCALYNTLPGGVSPPWPEAGSGQQGGGNNVNNDGCTCKGSTNCTGTGGRCWGELVCNVDDCTNPNPNAPCCAEIGNLCTNVNGFTAPAGDFCLYAGNSPNAGQTANNFKFCGRDPSTSTAAPTTAAPTTAAPTTAAPTTAAPTTAAPTTAAPTTAA